MGWFDADCRVDGWREALAAAGLQPHDLIVGDWSAPRGYEIGQAWDKRRLPDAIFCANDLTAVGLLAAFRERRIRVPENVSVVGFDDLPTAAYLHPALTTVRQPLEQVGELCVQVLLSAISGESPSLQALPPTLVVRHSTR